MTKKGGTRGMAENVDWGRKGSVLLRLLLCLFSLRGMGSIMFMFFLLFSRPRSLCVCTYLLLGHREGLENVLSVLCVGCAGINGGRA